MVVRYSIPRYICIRSSEPPSLPPSTLCAVSRAQCHAIECLSLSLCSSICPSVYLSVSFSLPLCLYLSDPDETTAAAGGTAVLLLFLSKFSWKALSAIVCLAIRPFAFVFAHTTLNTASQCRTGIIFHHPVPTRPPKEHPYGCPVQPTGTVEGAHEGPTK